MDNLNENTGTPEQEVTEEKTKTYTQEEVDELLQKEGDRRISQYQKTLEKRQREANKLSRMSESERAEYELSERERQLEESKAEKTQLHQDYSAVLLLFAQEKAEKHQLLLEVQEQKKIAIQEAEITEAEEETPEDEKKPEEVNKKPGFFARMFGRGKKGSADK